jgi:hypothetical protein
VSTLWTPSGDHEPEPARRTTPRGDESSPEELEIEAEMRAARAELISAPVADIVANHAVGLWQLAVLHLMPEPTPDGIPTAPRLDEAGLAIDALAALVDGLGARLAPHDEALRDALSQLRLAYVQVSGVQVSHAGDAPPP